MRALAQRVGRGIAPESAAVDRSGGVNIIAIVERDGCARFTGTVEGWTRVVSYLPFIQRARAGRHVVDDAGDGGCQRGVGIDGDGVIGRLAALCDPHSLRHGEVIPGTVCQWRGQLITPCAGGGVGGHCVE